jgi:dsRNA-specific ribonuclease
MKDFDNLLRELLVRAKIRDETIDKILDNPKYKSQFESAFIHKSYNDDAKRNYEKFEQLGDLVLNMAIVNYVVRKFPVIQSAHWLSNIKHRLISGKSFAALADKVGFYPHIKISDELKDEMDKINQRIKVKSGTSVVENKIYRGILEDVFEAFTGTLQWVVNDYSSLEAGPGYAVSYEFMKSFLDQIEIPTDVEKVFDTISLVKEIYDSQGWPNKTNEMTLSRKDPETGEHTVTYITVFPNTTRRVYLGSGKAYDKTEARRIAATETLSILKNRYNITKKVKDATST